MKTEEKSICPSCGSALSSGLTHCDICGEDIHAAASVPTEPQPQAVPPPEKPRAAEKAPSRKSAPKKAAAKSASAPGMMFTTTQWVAICIASFILGGALTATLMPPAGGAAPTEREENVQNQAQQPQIDFARLEEMRTFLESNPDDQDARLRYANDLHDAHLLDQAIAQYKVYLEAVPDNPDARVDLGICYFELKQYSAAIVEMQRAVADHPDHQLGNYNLGIVNLNAGDRETARSWFVKARDLDPTTPYGINAAEILKTQF